MTCKLRAYLVDIITRIIGGPTITAKSPLRWACAQCKI